MINKAVQCDDKLELFALKNDWTRERNQKLSVHKNYKKTMHYAKDREGKPIIYGYAHRVKEQTFISVSKFDELDLFEKAQYLPCIERELFTKFKSVLIRERDNRLIVRMLGLSKTFEMLEASRYRTVLDVLCGLTNVILVPSYTLADERTTRHEQERVRQVLKRRFSIRTYEYNILLFDSGLANSVLSESIKYCQKAKKEYYDSAQSATAYIRKEGKDRAGIVVYNAGLKHYSNNEGLEKLVKIEVKLNGTFLRKHGIDITSLTTQEQSIKAVRGVAMAELNRVSKTMPWLRVATERAKQENEVLSRLMRVESRVDSVEDRLAELERKAGKQ